MKIKNGSSLAFAKTNVNSCLVTICYISIVFAYVHQRGPQAYEAYEDLTTRFHDANYD